MVGCTVTNRAAVADLTAIVYALVQVLRRIRVLGRELLAGFLRILNRWLLNRLPSVGRMLLPLAIVAAIDIAVASGIDVAALAACDKSVVAIGRAPMRTGAASGRPAADTGEVRAMLDGGRPPAAVNIVPAASNCSVAGTGIIGGDKAAFTRRSIACRTADIGAGAWIVGSAGSDAAIGAIGVAVTTECAYRRIVECADAIGYRARIIGPRATTRPAVVPVVVIVPAGAVDERVPGKIRAEIPHGISEPNCVRLGLVDPDIGGIVDRRRRRDRVDFRPERPSQR